MTTDLDGRATVSESHPSLPLARSYTTLHLVPGDPENDFLLQEFLDDRTAKNIGIGPEMTLIKAAMKQDPALAWAWHCGLAGAASDEGLNHTTANRVALRFMFRLFDMDRSHYPAHAAYASTLREALKIRDPLSDEQRQKLNKFAIYGWTRDIRLRPDNPDESPAAFHTDFHKGTEEPEGDGWVALTKHPRETAADEPAGESISPIPICPVFETHNSDQFLVDPSVPIRNVITPGGVRRLTLPLKPGVTHDLIDLTKPWTKGFVVDGDSLYVERVHYLTPEKKVFEMSLEKSRSSFVRVTEGNYRGFVLDLEFRTHSSGNPISIQARVNTETGKFLWAIARSVDSPDYTPIGLTLGGQLTMGHTS